MHEAMQMQSPGADERGDCLNAGGRELTAAKASVQTSRLILI